MFGLIGEKLGHSYSKPIHQLLSGGAYEYELVPVAQEAFDTFLKACPLDGFNVTIPYKKRILPLLAHISEEAKKIGSVNTVIVRKDGLHGFNTDYAGFLFMAGNASIDFCGKKVLILGSGGTSATAAAVVRDRGAREVVIVSRGGAVTYEHLNRHRDAQILVNTTPVGMYPNNGESLMNLADFPACEGVLDVIYNPLCTDLVLQAREKGIPAGSGMSMLVAQAKYASEIFLGRIMDDRRIESVLNRMLRQIQNIVLVGMPGSGKSTLGERVAALTGKTFVDIDLEIVRRAGKMIPQIFADDGEPAFRDLEAEITAEKGKEHGLVIAGGGGVVLRPENRTALRQNGKVVFLRRELSALPTAGRPLSENLETLRRMYETRLPYYLACSDYTVENNCPLEETTREILRVIGEK